MLSTRTAGELALSGRGQLGQHLILGAVQGAGVLAVVQLLAHLLPERFHGVHLAHLLGKIAVQGRQLTHAHVMQLDLEHNGLAGQLLVGVVLGEGDVDLELVPCLVAQNAILETGDHAAAAQLHGLVLCRAALKGHTVQKTLKVHVHTLPFTAGPLWGTSSAAALRRRSSTASISLSVTAGVTHSTWKPVVWVRFSSGCSGVVAVATKPRPF